ncbi:MAG: GTPase HflX [Anaerolineae bacterium]
MTNTDREFSTNYDRLTERGFLVGVELRTHRFKTGLLSTEDSLEELAALANTAGVEVMGGTIQRLNRPQPATLVGTGKLDELRGYKDELGIEVFIFDAELNPRQQRGLEKELEVKVLDRTALILDIFARHARTKEGQLQVELAQLEYRLPRLTRLWSHLARQAGGRAGGATGGVGLRGPGETQIEVDRREINRKIARLKESLQKVRAQRARHRERRRQTNTPLAAIVGYTNAGKSTLLNTLVRQAGPGDDRPPIYVADQLFATLDPTTRRVQLPQGKEILFSDTVGFIQKLPTQLVAAFRATLEEVTEADILIHVIDITHPNAPEQAQSVAETLRRLQATHIPIITVLNKIDAFSDSYGTLQQQLDGHAGSIPLSAKTGKGVDALLRRVEQLLQRQMVPLRLHLPYAAGNLVALLHEQAIIQTESHDEFGTLVTARVPARLTPVFDSYRIEANV